MKYDLKPTNDLIDGQLEMAADWENAGQSSVPGMSYEQGVQAALRWAIGDEKDCPIGEAIADAE
jgi:hypothetical protein